MLCGSTAQAALATARSIEILQNPYAKTLQQTQYLRGRIQFDDDVSELYDAQYARYMLRNYVQSNRWLQYRHAQDDAHWYFRISGLSCL